MIEVNEAAKRLYLRFTTIWGDKHTSRFTDENIIQMWIQDWSEVIPMFELNVIKGAIDYCKVHFKWPPCIAEFIEICEKSLNIPDHLTCMRDAIRGDFSNPLTKSIYDKIGSWSMRNDKEVDLIKKFKSYHEEELINMRTSNHKKHKSIGSDNVKYISMDLI